jgi:hypothetical protein
MKKVLSVLVIVLFMSTSSLSAIELVQSDCTEDTFDVMEFADDLGFDEATVTCVGNMFYAECSGYSVNYDDCF